MGWFYSRKILNTYALTYPQYARAYVDGVGWKRIKPGAADGVTNVHLALSSAQANARLAHVLVEDATNQITAVMVL